MQLWPMFTITSPLRSPLKRQINHSHLLQIWKTSTKDLHQALRQRKADQEAWSSLTCLHLIDKSGMQDWTAIWEELENRDMHKREKHRRTATAKVSAGWRLKSVEALAKALHPKKLGLVFHWSSGKSQRRRKDKTFDGEREERQEEAQHIQQIQRQGRSQNVAIK